MARNESRTMYIMCRKFRILKDEGKIEFVVEDEYDVSLQPDKSFYRWIDGEDDYYWFETDIIFEPSTPTEEYMLGRLKECHKEVRRRHKDL